MSSQAPAKGKESGKGYVTTVNPTDVLFGRGSGANDHEGNIRFRQYVAERKDEYMATNHRMTKAKIAREIVDKVIADEGRFLKKLEPHELEKYGVPPGVDAWVEVDDDTVMEKAKQALRQNTHKRQPSADQQKKTPPEPKTYTRVSPTSTNKDDDLPEYADLEPIPITSTGYSRPSPPEPQPAQVLPAAAMAPPRVDPWSGNEHGSNRPAATSSRPDDMLAHVNPNAMHRNMHPAETTLTHLSQEALPIVNRRESMTMSELAQEHSKRHQNQKSMEMSELVDSFNRTRIDPNDTRKLYESTETMGTIEPIGDRSIADMSIGTMNSSTFSFMKGNDSMFGPGGFGTEGDSKQGAQWNDKQSQQPDSYIDFHAQTNGPSAAAPGRENISESAGTAHTGAFTGSNGASQLMSESSISLGAINDFFAQKRKSSSLTTGGMSGLRGLKEEDMLQGTQTSVPPVGLLPEDPPVDLSYEGMGQSSVAILKEMLQSTQEFDGTEDHLHTGHNSGDPSRQR